MADSQFWHDMEARFRALNGSAGDLRADCSYIVGSRGPGEWGRAVGVSKSARTQFEALAKMAGAATENAAISDPLASWLDLLRQEGSNFCVNHQYREMYEDGTYGPYREIGSLSVCEASADYCSALESRAFIGAAPMHRRLTAEVKQPSTPDGPPPVDGMPATRRGRKRNTPNLHPEVDVYLEGVREAAGKSITFEQFCRVAGFGDDTVFGAWRRGNDKRCSPGQARVFENTLKLAPVEFLKRLTEKSR